MLRVGLDPSSKSALFGQKNRAYAISASVMP